MPEGDRGYRVGVDIGGTFTDIVVLDEKSGDLSLYKTPSTPRDFWFGVEAGIRKVSDSMDRVSMIVHGTTVGLNAFLMRRGEKAGLITTRGFRDIYDIGRHNRESMYDLRYRKPEPLVPREHRLEVTERLDARGNVVTPLDEDEVRACVRKFKAEGVRSIAVCLIHSYANAAHEDRIGEILAEEYPEATVSLSHDVAREWREYERTSTVAINAYIRPIVDRYLSNMETQLERQGYMHRLFICQSSGGVSSVEVTKLSPVSTLMSGPAGGAVGTAQVSGLEKIPRAIGFDMGGTSTDVCVSIDGNVLIRTEYKIERHPLLVPMVDVQSIGAGGGSIAWVDSVGALNVGPQSAGAEPGPVCYDKGGTEVTTTDANLVLGRLNPDYFLGGEMAVRPDLSAKRLDEKVAGPLKLDRTAAAAGILRVVNTKMAYAVRAVTVERGLSPREFALVAFGGAGPMHACDVAAELEIPTVLVPVAPGQFSALGMLYSDIRHDFAWTFLTKTREVDRATLDERFDSLAKRAGEVLEQEDVPREKRRFVRSADMRYVGQEWSVNVPFGEEAGDTDWQANLESRFHELHKRNYGYSAPEEPTEIVNLRLTAVGLVVNPRLRELARGGADHEAQALKGTRKVYFPSLGWNERTPIYERERLLAGNKLAGPAVVEEPGSTTVVPPGWTATVSAYGNMLIRKNG